MDETQTHAVGEASLCANNERRRRKMRRSFLLQQSWDVDVPADGLPVEAAGEQVAGGVVLTPGGAANHPAVTLSVAPRESSQSDSRHVKQSDLPIVVEIGRAHV